MALTKATHRMIEGASVNVKDYGLLGGRDTGDLAKLQTLIDSLDTASAGEVYFPNDEYQLDGLVTINKNKININLGGSTIYFGGTGSGFGFGSVRTDDQVDYSDIQIHNGTITNADYTEVENRNYILFSSVQKASAYNLTMRYVSNGGIYVHGASRKITIRDINIYNTSSYTTCRAIWVAGANASDYAGQLVDISTLERNATALSVIKPREILIENVNIELTTSGYGIYIMNANEVTVSKCNVDTGTSGGRCIAINNHSPNTKVLGCTLKASNTSTGILVTQASDNVIISDNIFLGDRIGGRDIYVAYLADALISNNVFLTGTNTKILIDMGGSARIIGNTISSTSWLSGEVGVRIFPIDAAVAGTSTYGDTATEVSEVYVSGNSFKKITAPVMVTQNTSNSGNIPGIKNLTVEENIGYDFDNATGGDHMIVATSLNSANKINLNMNRNKAYPFSYMGLSGLGDAAGYTNVKTQDFGVGIFKVEVPSGGAALVVTQQSDTGFFELSGVHSASNVILVPRAADGGGAVGKIINIVPYSTNMASFKITDWTTINWDVSVYDHSGTQIDLSTTAATFYVYMQHSY